MKIRLMRPVFDRDKRYESSSRLIRWVCLGLVLITYPFDASLSVAVFSLVAAIALYNGLRYNKRLFKQAFFSSRINTLVVDNIFVFVLVAFTGGLASPYYPFFLLLIIAIIASYGVAGFALALAAQVIVTPLLLLAKTEPLPSSPEFGFIVKIVFLIIFSFVAEQLVRSRDEEHLLEASYSKRVENERHRLLALINSLSSAVLALNKHGKVYLYNAAALELLNTNRDISGEHIGKLLQLHDDKYTTVDIYQLIADQKTAINRQDLRYVPEDGSEMILDLTISPVHGQHTGKADDGGYMVVFRDITKQKTLEQERDEFISVTSHELRTPLAIAEANLSTALLPGFAKIEPKAADLLNQAHENVVFLSALIKDLSTLSRAERGSLSIEKELISLDGLVEDLARDYRAQAEAKDLKLIAEIDKKTKKVYTSELELKEILQNFITNAIKYTVKGKITISLEDHGVTAIIRVKDTGIGLSASDKTKIFDKFYRSEDYRTRSTGGTGLGLYITKKLAKHLGLAIDFSSTLNRGSTFSVVIPYRIDPADAKVVAESAQGQEHNRVGSTPL